MKFSYSVCLLGIFLVCVASSVQEHGQPFHRKYQQIGAGYRLDGSDSTTQPAVPTKASPTTAAPTKAVPTTAVPTKAAPTKASPTTAAPTKASPTTAAPTKASPTTAQPTKASPTSAAPTSAAPTKSPVTTPPTTLKPRCTPGQKKPITGHCSDYIECDQTFEWVNKTCTVWCHNFNPTAMKCDWSWKYVCHDPTSATPCTDSNRTTPSSSGPTTPAPTGPTTPTPAPETTTPTTTTTTTPKPTTTTVAPCVNGKAKIFKKGDCKNYLECDSGKWTKKTCSLGFDFDINKLECRFSWWAKC